MNSPTHDALQDRIHRPDKLGLLVTMLVDEGVSASATLRGSDLSVDMLGHTATRVSVRQMLTVYAQAQTLSADPALALRAGLRIRITHFGLYGYALLASATPRQAIDFALRYRALASPVIGLSFGLAGPEAVWSFDDVMGLGRRSDLYRFVVEMQLGTQLALHRDLLGTALTPARILLPYAAPTHAPRYAELLGCAPQFDAGVSELRFDAAWLEHPLAFANPLTAELVQQTCDKLLAEMEQSPPDATSMASRVAALMLQAPGRFPDIEALAADLQLSSRTLRRHLQAEGTSYQQLLDNVRQQLALDYLRSTRMSTDDIAAALGFSDSANFRHAFKRWTGQSPGSLRNMGPGTAGERA